MNIQNGKLFFDSTNVPVRETLEQFAYGKSIDQIADTLQGKVSKEEIASALQQAIEAMGEIYDHPLRINLTGQWNSEHPLPDREIRESEAPAEPYFWVRREPHPPIPSPSLRPGSRASPFFILKLIHMREAIDLAIDALEKVYKREL